MLELKTRYGRALEPLRLNFDSNHVRRLRELSLRDERSMSAVARQLIAWGLERLEREQNAA